MLLLGQVIKMGLPVLKTPARYRWDDRDGGDRNGHTGGRGESQKLTSLRALMLSSATTHKPAWVTFWNTLDQDSPIDQGRKTVGENLL